MNFSTYADFRNAFQTLLTGDSVNGSALDFGQVELLVGMAEERIYQGGEQTPGLRAAAMVKTATVTTVGGIGPLPTDYLAGKIAYFDPTIPLEYVGNNQMGEDGRTGSKAVVWTQEGGNIHVSPSQDGALTLLYYARLPSVTNGINALVTAYPLLFLYAALAEGGAFLQLPAAAAWEDRFKQCMSAAIRNETWETALRPRIRSR